MGPQLPVLPLTPTRQRQLWDVVLTVQTTLPLPAPPKGACCHTRKGLGATGRGWKPPAPLAQACRVSLGLSVSTPPASKTPQTSSTLQALSVTQGASQ